MQDNMLVKCIVQSEEAIYIYIYTYIHTSIHTSSKIFEKHMGCNKPLSSASGVTPKGKQQGAGLKK